MAGGWHCVDGWRINRSDGKTSGEYMSGQHAETAAAQARLVWPDMEFSLVSTQDEDRRHPIADELWTSEPEWRAAHDGMGRFVLGARR
jgi:hypothetical protein